MNPRAITLAVKKAADLYKDSSLQTWKSNDSAFGYGGSNEAEATSRPPHSPGGLYGGARSEGGRISATGGKFWAKIRILWGIASGASGLSPPQAENFFENDAFKEKIY